jgi:hypothetical protein
MDYTDEELKEFRRLVQMGESSRQMDRIESRLEIPRFIEKVGRQKCDEMFEVLKAELK